jgi:hypothetical protein
LIPRCKPHFLFPVDLLSCSRGDFSCGKDSLLPIDFRFARRLFSCPGLSCYCARVAALRSLREAIALEQAVVTGFPLDVLLFFALGSLLSDFSPCRLVLSFIVESS